MRDIKGAFQRTSEISREVSKTSGWLEDFAEQMALKEQVTKTASITKEARAVTAVEVARNKNMQPSIYEMMSAIVSGNKPKFSSVEEAVKDYQERTGLAQYLKAQEEERMAAYAAVINDYKDYGHESEFNVDPKIVLKEIIDLLSSDEPYALDSAAQLFEGIIDTFLINNNYNLKESDRFQLKNKLLRYVAEHNKEGAENLAEILGMNESNPKLLEESYDDSYLDIGTPVEPVGPSTNTADQMSADDEDKDEEFLSFLQWKSDNNFEDAKKLAPEDRAMFMEIRKYNYDFPIDIFAVMTPTERKERLKDEKLYYDLDTKIVQDTGSSAENAMMDLGDDFNAEKHPLFKQFKEIFNKIRTRPEQYSMGNRFSPEIWQRLNNVSTNTADQMSADDEEENKDEDDCKTSLASIIRQYNLEVLKKKV